MIATWGYWAMEVFYVAGLLTLIALSLMALLKKSVWISVFEAALLLGVCVSAVTLFESPPRPGVVGLVACASILCLSVYRRWLKLEAERRAATQAAAQSALAATGAAKAAVVAATVAEETAELSGTDDARHAAKAASAAATDAIAGAAEAAQAAASVTTEEQIIEAAQLARQAAAELAARRAGDDLV